MTDLQVQHQMIKILTQSLWKCHIAQGILSVFHQYQLQTDFFTTCQPEATNKIRRRINIHFYLSHLRKTFLNHMPCILCN